MRAHGPTGDEPTNIDRDSPVPSPVPPPRGRDPSLLGPRHICDVEKIQTPGKNTQTERHRHLVYVGHPNRDGQAA